PIPDTTTAARSTTHDDPKHPPQNVRRVPGRRRLHQQTLPHGPPPRLHREDPPLPAPSSRPGGIKNYCSNCVVGAPCVSAVSGANGVSTRLNTLTLASPE